MLNVNGRTAYIRETLENVLPAYGLTPPEISEYRQSLMEKLTPQSFPLPQHFFDFDRSARILARMEKIQPEEARKMLLSNPDVLIEMHDVRTGNASAIERKQRRPYTRKEPQHLNGHTQPKEKFGQRGATPLPDNDVIAACAKAYKDAQGYLPGPRSTGPLSHAGGLPDSAPAWSSIVVRLSKERGVTLAKLVAALSPNPMPPQPVKASPPPAVSKGKRGRTATPLPDDKLIASCALRHKEMLGNLPTMKSVGALSRAGGLPDDAPVWTSIIARLPKERGSTISGLINQHFPDALVKPRGALLPKKRREPRILPTNEAILACALRFREICGKIPNIRTTGPLAYEGGLPENSFGWAVLVKVLPQQRKTTVFKLVKEHDKIHRLHMPRRKAVDLPENDIIGRCAHAYKQKHGHLPGMKSTGLLSRDGGLPDNSPAWTSIVLRLSKERQTTIGILAQLHEQKLHDLTIANLPVRSAKWAFNAVVRNIQNGQPMIDDTLELLFRHNKITQIGDVVGDKIACGISCAKEFVVAAGLATAEKRSKLTPVSPEVIAQYARLIAQ